jgi:hypothetical protein
VDETDLFSTIEVTDLFSTLQDLVFDRFIFWSEDLLLIQHMKNLGELDDEEI